MVAEKLSRRQREKLSQRRQILATALELFVKKGYHNVSMHEIAKKVEFGIGTLYRFFKNKEQLYKALMMEKAEEYHRILSDVLSKEDHTLVILEDYIAAKARIFADNVALLRLYFAETRGASFNIKAGLDQDIRKLNEKLVDQVASVLEQGIRIKVIRPLNPYYMAVALEALTNGFLFCWMEDPERHPYEKNVPLIKDLLLAGIMIR